MIINNIQNLILEIDLNKNNNYELNFNEWINGQNNILYVTGLMGSGKTTFTKLLAKQYNCPLIELDMFIKEKIDQKIKDAYNNKDFIDYFFKELNKETKKHNKVIVEGIQILYLNDYKGYLSQADSIIIINKSFIKSTINSIKRDGFDQIFNNIKSNLEFKSAKDAFITTF